MKELRLGAEKGWTEVTGDVGSSEDDEEVIVKLHLSVASCSFFFPAEPLKF